MQHDKVLKTPKQHFIHKVDHQDDIEYTNDFEQQNNICCICNKHENNRNICISKVNKFNKPTLLLIQSLNLLLITL